MSEPKRIQRKGNKMSTLKELVLQKAKEGKVVSMTIDGPMSADLEEFVKQPAEGILYDLNRDKVTVLTFIDDVKWVNDFAVALVIEELKSQITDLEEQAEVYKGAKSVIDGLRAALDEARRMFKEYTNWGKFGHNHQPAAWLEKYKE